MITIDQKAISRKQSISVGFFFKNVKNKFNFKLYSDESGFGKTIYDQNLHRPGLALAGFV